MLNSKECFARWAPPESHWSAWAKPTLFVSMDRVELDRLHAVSEAFEHISLPGADEGWALIVELEGVLSIRFGLHAAAAGYRPVPLYNCWSDAGTVEAVPTKSLINELAKGALVLESKRLGSDAPPAFLLDQNRLKGKETLVPGDFDNRWMVFPQDFPSARYLKDHGIKNVLWITREPATPNRDLAHIVFEWQTEGIPIHARTLPADASKLIHVSRPSGFQSLWHRALAILTFKRNSAGGFGSIIPDPSSSGGGG